MEEGSGSPRTRRFRSRGCGCGGGLFFFVLTVGILLSLLNLGVGVGVSVRVPFTESNVTLAGVLGAKGKAVAAFPSYTDGRLGGNQSLFNNSTPMTIHPPQRDDLSRAVDHE